ncbi:hypothetical protein GUJ93_ZPchr0013g38003 [Zizania palustris]|uniref:Uncharacterized protein n=1 Tax=Zizania palustris TaxID=103762 RepID=A0A8J6C1R8_ZIZPA|nr:hypothetical protein GUJ93_ZPchr0013g38003 [Zizania palustris]
MRGACLPDCTVSWCLSLVDCDEEARLICLKRMGIACGLWVCACIYAWWVCAFAGRPHFHHCKFAMAVKKDNTRQSRYPQLAATATIADGVAQELKEIGGLIEGAEMITHAYAQIYSSYITDLFAGWKQASI